MTDRELIELAAKTMGASINGYRYGQNGKEPLFALWVETDDGYEAKPWNPLEDDADSLNLAVNLKIDIVFEYDENNIRCNNTVTAAVGTDIGCSEFLIDDPCAATRRAITRAAAEIGRRMK